MEGTDDFAPTVRLVASCVQRRSGCNRFEVWVESTNLLLANKLGSPGTQISLEDRAVLHPTELHLQSLTLATKDSTSGNR